MAERSYSDEISERLEVLSVAAQVAFAARCALRVYPLIGQEGFLAAWKYDSKRRAETVLAAALAAASGHVPAARAAYAAAFGAAYAAAAAAAVAAAAAAARAARSANANASNAAAVSDAANAAEDASNAATANLVGLVRKATAIDLDLMLRLDSGTWSGVDGWKFFERPLFDGTEARIEQLLSSEVSEAFQSAGLEEILRIWEGFFYGKPMPREEVVKWLDRWLAERESEEPQKPLAMSSKAESQKKLAKKNTTSAPKIDGAETSSTSTEPTSAEAAEEVLEETTNIDVATCSAEGPALVDSLNRQHLVLSLARMLSMPEQETPMTLGLFGHWGAGKSTVMTLLQKELSNVDSRKKYPNFEFLFGWFNAWEYEHTDNIRAGLAQEVVNGLLSDGRFDEESPRLTGKLGWWARYKLRVGYLWKESRSDFLWLLGKAAVVVGGVIAGLWGLRAAGLLQEDLAQAGVLGIGAYIGVQLFRQMKVLWEHPLATELATFFKLPSFKSELGQVPIIRKQMETLCRTRLKKKRRLVLFVDDLDRCQTETIAQAFDAIRLIAHIKGVVIMVGIDERIAFKAMGSVYKDYADSTIGRSKEDVARDYLGKIIQVPIRLDSPSAEGLRSYVEEKLFPKESRFDPDAASAPVPDSSKSQNPVQASPPLPNRVGERADRSKPREQAGEMTKTPEHPETKAQVDLTLAEEKAEVSLAQSQMRDTDEEVSAFRDLSAFFEFGNPRQLLRLRNTYRLLKALSVNRGQEVDTDQRAALDMLGEHSLLMMLFWLEFRTQFDGKFVQEWLETLTKKKPDPAKPVVGSIRSGLLNDVDSEQGRFPFRSEPWRQLEGFALTCLLPSPHREANIARDAKAVPTDG